MRISSLAILLLAPGCRLAAADTPAVSFVNDVVPILTMSGCAGSNCHGSIRGQNGFKLSLFGYEPGLDHEAISGGQSPRVDRNQPENSLILRKPTMQVPHGGGLRFPADSVQYRTLLDWVRQGAAFDTDTPRIVSLSVAPEERLLVGAGSSVQLHATARFSDGATRDVGSRVQFSSNNPDVVQVSTSGLVKALMPGETAVMVRALGKAAAARILVAASAPTLDYPAVAANHFIDEHVFDKLRRLNIVPAPLSGDSQFLRRVYLDTIGLPPAEAQAEAFLRSTDPAKRARLIDRLLERPEFAEFWALKLTELSRAGTREAGAKGGRIVYEYLRRSFLANKPWDRLVSELLLSQGAHLFGTAPSSFYNISFDSNAPDHAVNVGQVFLGVRIECARCHDHPWEKWTQDDFHGFAAFFARVGIKEVYENDENATVYKEEGTIVHPKTGKVVVPKYLDGDYEPDHPDRDIRVALTRWMSSPRNPFFARATVNRVWKHFLGRGLVEEVDDFRVTNPPTNPALLDALAADFAGHGYDFRRLVRVMLNSRVYQLSAEPNESNQGDSVNYSRYYIRRLMGEQMLDAMTELTGVSEKFNGYPPGTRAMQVYSGANYMLAAFGRLNRDIICERDQQPDMAQTMHLIGGDTIQRKIAAPSSDLERWLKDASLSDDRILERIFLRAWARYPRDAERAAIRAALGEAASAAHRRAVFQDLLWAIVNSKAFLYNH